MEIMELKVFDCRLCLNEMSNVKCSIGFWLLSFNGPQIVRRATGSEGLREGQNKRLGERIRYKTESGEEGGWEGGRELSG